MERKLYTLLIYFTYILYQRRLILLPFPLKTIYSPPHPSATNNELFLTYDQWWSSKLAHSLTRLARFVLINSFPYMCFGSLEREETIYGAGFNILVSIECCLKVSKTYQINKKSQNCMNQRKKIIWRISLYCIFILNVTQYSSRQMSVTFHALNTN